MLSGEKMMISSIRLRNSGRKVSLSAFSIFSCDSVVSASSLRLQEAQACRPA